MRAQTSAGGRPTRRQLETLVVYIEVGSIGAAAHELGIAETTVRQHLSGLYRRTGCQNAAQAAYRLGAGEWRVARSRLGRGQVSYPVDSVAAAAMLMASNRTDVL